MRRNSLRRGSLLAAIALATLWGAASAQAQVAYTANTIQSLYYKEMVKEGRIYVFNSAARAESFEKSGEFGTGISRIGVGPNGETVMAENETALELFFFKNNIAQEVARPKTPNLNIVVARRQDAHDARQQLLHGDLQPRAGALHARPARRHRQARRYGGGRRQQGLASASAAPS